MKKWTTYTILAVVALSIVSFTLYYYSNATHIMENEHNALVAMKAEKFNFEINEIIAHRKSFVRHLSTYLSLREGADKAAVLQSLNAYKAASPDNADNYYYISVDGWSVCGNEALCEENYGPDRKVWYEKALETTSGMVTEPYIAPENGHLLVAVTSPVYIKGAFAGVYAVELDLSEIENKLNAAPHHKKSYGFIFSSGGNIVIHPNKDFQPKVNGYVNVFNEDNIYYPLISAYNNGVTTFTLKDYDGITRVFMISEIQSCDWNIVTAVSTAAIKAEQRPLVVSSLIIPVFTVLLLGVLIYIYETGKKKKEAEIKAMVAISTLCKEALIKEKIDRLREAMSLASDIVISLFEPKTMELESIIGSWEGLTGLSTEETIHNPSRFNSILAAPDDTNTILRILSGDIKKKETAELNIIHAKTGKNRWLRFTFTPITVEEKPKLLLEVVDMTEQKMLQQMISEERRKAEQANTAKTRFLSSMSHEIRTPLTGILGLTGIALENADNPGVMKDCLAKIQSSSSHLQRLVNNILDMTAIENNKVFLNNENVSLQEIFSDVRNILEAKAEEKQLNLTIDTSAITDECVKADKLQLSKVFLNIASNAIKYTDTGGKVSITASEISRKGNNVTYRFVFADTGCGMSPEFIENNLFTPFDRERTASVLKVEGTGIGMTITKKLVDLMKGTIDVQSKVGEGTIFTVDLTFEMCKTVIKKPVASGNLSASSDFSGKRMIFAEDNEVNREIVKAFLSNTKIEIDVAENGKEALDIFSKSTAGYYNIILMDVQMPVMGGYEATRAIRALPRPDAKNVPILAFTADAFCEDRMLALDSGMNDHVPKPVEKESLILSIKKWII